MFELPEIPGIKKIVTIESIPKQEEQQADAVYRQRVRDSFEQVGFRESLQEEIFDRLTLLEKGSKFNEYSLRIAQGMENVLNLLEERHAKDYPETGLTKKQHFDGRVAAILHDIGKSGPVDATESEQEMIIKIFAQENIRNSEALVTETIAGIFDESQLPEVLGMLEKQGIGGKTTMLEFWNKHAQWTHDILEKYPQGLNKHIRIIAGSHHIDRIEPIDPYGLLEKNKEIPLEARVIGTMEEYLDALDGRVLNALDQYEAAIQRGNLSHENALNRVRNCIVIREGDKLMNLVLEAIDELGRAGKIFEQSVEI